MIYQTSRKEHLRKDEGYRHTGNCAYGRRGLHKRLRKYAKDKIKRELYTNCT